MEAARSSTSRMLLSSRWPCSRIVVQRVSVQCSHSSLRQSSTSSASLDTNPQGRKRSPEELESARLAFEQRQILAKLRGSDGSSPAASTSAPNATASSVLSSMGGTGAPMPSGMLGDASLQMPRQGSNVFERMAGEGKSWKQLKGGQKVARVTLVSSRSVLVIGGLGLTLVIFYALATELFAPNSPTVIYSEACSLITRSPQIHQNLLPPFRYHTSSHSVASTSQLPGLSSLPRKGSRHPSARTVSNASGDDVLLLHFFMDARDRERDLTLWEQAREGVLERARWARKRGGELWEEWTAAEHEEGETNGGSGVLAQAQASASSESGWLSLPTRAVNATVGSLTSTFRRSGEALGAVTQRYQPGTFSSGEVHGELIKGDDGAYRWSRLFVDVPSTSSAVRTRIVLELSEEEKARGR